MFFFISLPPVAVVNYHNRREGNKKKEESVTYAKSKYDCIYDVTLRDKENVIHRFMEDIDLSNSHYQKLSQASAEACA
jgi:hypothetical protein